MARVTVEDCVEKIPNRFELVLLAGHRARAVAAGAALTVERDRDKNPVVALREIAEDSVTNDNLREDLVQSLCRHIEAEEPEGRPVGLLENASSGIDPSDKPDETPMMSEEEILQALGQGEPEPVRAKEPEEEDYDEEE